MSTLQDLERKVARLEAEMARQRFGYQALEQLLELLASFAETSDRQALRSGLIAWAERLRARR